MLLNFYKKQNVIKGNRILSKNMEYLKKTTEGISQTLFSKLILLIFRGVSLYVALLGFVVVDY